MTQNKTISTIRYRGDGDTRLVKLTDLYARQKYRITKLMDELKPFDYEMTAIAQYYNIPKEWIVLRCRKREIVEARQCLATLMLRTMTSTHVAELLGYNDHSTVLHCESKTKDIYDIDSRFKDFFDTVSHNHPFGKFIEPTYPKQFTSMAFRYGL